MIMPPPDMLPHRRLTKSEIELAKKQAMADKIMTCLKTFQPKKKRKQRK